MESEASRPECAVLLPGLPPSPGSHAMTIAFSADFDAQRNERSKRWPVVIGLAAAATMAVVGARTPIVRHAPRAAVLFESVGLPVNLSGVAIERVGARIALDGDRRILVVEGELVNPGDRAETARPLLVSVRGADGEPLYTWSTRAPQQQVSGGERAAFVARLASPPANASSVLVEFDRSEGEARAKVPASSKNRPIAR